MMRAYDEVLVERAADSLGRMLDFAVYSLHQDVTAMMDLFCASGVAGLFERGDVRTIAGTSGIELAYEVLDRSGLAYERVSPRHTKSLSGEYWWGQALARAQWGSGIPFWRVMQDCPAPSFLAEYGRRRVELLDRLPLDITESERIGTIRTFGREFAQAAAQQPMQSAGYPAPGAAGAAPSPLAVSQTRRSRPRGLGAA